MRVAVLAVGRMKSGPEKELAQRYFDRFRKTGAGIGLDFAGVAELAESRAAGAEERRREEAAALAARIEAGSALVLLDERGAALTSQDFARMMAGHRDAGRKTLLFSIGGADGHHPSLADRASLVLSFGALTWPHQLARIMLAEQLYRAATILSGHPYHRA